uniref:D-isomer specific 2-hydroxyacid dehydrogenase NAD-binding domain-containing protein n=1 Tax=Monodon monoceros TaxID=40151 RepID=A0A8C6ARE9_MONMO
MGCSLEDSDILVSGLEGRYGICEDHAGDLQKCFNLITMQEFLENKTQLGPKTQAVYVWGGRPAVSQELRSPPCLKIVAGVGAGPDHLDPGLVASFSVKAANTPHAVSNPTADLGMALLLAAARSVVEGHHLAISPHTENFSTDWIIGCKIAQRARAFEMEILYHSRKRRESEEEVIGATYCERLDDLLQRSDFVMLAVSLTPQAQGLIGRRELSGMEPTAILSTSAAVRLLVDQDALVEALQTGVIKAAVLDVTYPEPLPRDHPLLELKNVTLTPHIGSATHQARRQTMENLVESILASLNGLPIPNEVLFK